MHILRMNFRITLYFNIIYFSVYFYVLKMYSSTCAICIWYSPLCIKHCAFALNFFFSFLFIVLGAHTVRPAIDGPLWAVVPLNYPLYQPSICQTVVVTLTVRVV